MFELYQDVLGQWRWRFKATNGNIMADSSEGYHNRADIVASLNSFVEKAPTARIVDAPRLEGAGRSDDD